MNSTKKLLKTFFNVFPIFFQSWMGLEKLSVMFLIVPPNHSFTLHHSKMEYHAIIGDIGLIKDTHKLTIDKHKD
jgi:hypothetical protein